jgi:type III pantothenate kinase
MLLLIDAGNTSIKWALVEDGAAPGVWVASGALAHDAVAPGIWAGRPISGALISNVAGAALRARLELALPDGLQRASWFASQPQLAGLKNGYRNPAQLGCDRFAAAIGARALAPGRPLIVATCGTATTIDAITPDGRFIGGLILPGLGLMASSLARNTSQLPQVGPAAGIGNIQAGFADNTDDAIINGCLAAQAGAIERACAALEAEWGAVHCMLSGGAAGYIAPALSRQHQMIANIVLIGLQVAANSGELSC